MDMAVEDITHPVQQFLLRKLDDQGGIRHYVLKGQEKPEAIDFEAFIALFVYAEKRRTKLGILSVDPLLDNDILYHEALELTIPEKIKAQKETDHWPLKLSVERELTRQGLPVSVLVFAHCHDTEEMVTALMCPSGTSAATGLSEMQLEIRKYQLHH